MTKQDYLMTWMVPVEARDIWCVYEHSITIANSPPVVIFVNSCKLIDVFGMREAFDNSEWMRQTDHGKLTVFVKVVATFTDRFEAYRYMTAHILGMPAMPICNLQGVQASAVKRRIICSNGQTFDTQQEAARSLGTSQSAISAHLNGRLPRIKGCTLAWSDVPR